ncbi:MAG TPA: glycosyltransferase [Rhodocyclaceae bacterium]
MIFVTVGHSMPFDRMVRLVDAWAGKTGRTDLFAQIGDADYEPANFPSTRFLTPAEYERHLIECDAIIAHAGTGTILQALYLGKPMLALTRLASLGEATSDHQLGTARYFAEQGQIMVATENEEFSRALGTFEFFQPRSLTGKEASPQLIDRIRRFLIDEERT